MGAYSRGLVCKNDFLGVGIFEDGLIKEFTVCTVCRC